MQHRVPFLRLATPPASEPLTLSETKLYLRLDDSSDDADVTRMIAGARQAAEAYMRRSLITQSWVLAYDKAAPEHVPLPRGPVQSITGVAIISRDGSSTALDSGTYRLNNAREMLEFTTCNAHLGHVVEITYVTGYGTAESSVPEQIRQGMLAHIGAMFDDRSGASPLPPAARSLYEPFRVVAL